MFETATSAPRHWASANDLRNIDNHHEMPIPIARPRLSLPKKRAELIQISLDPLTVRPRYSPHAKRLLNECDAGGSRAAGYIAVSNNGRTDRSCLS